MTTQSKFIKHYPQKRRKQEATQLLQEAKKLDKNNMLTEQIKMMMQMKKI